MTVTWQLQTDCVHVKYNIVCNQQKRLSMIKRTHANIVFFRMLQMFNTRDRGKRQKILLSLKWRTKLYTNYWNSDSGLSTVDQVWPKDTHLSGLYLRELTNYSLKRHNIRYINRIGELRYYNGSWIDRLNCNYRGKPQKNSHLLWRPGRIVRVGSALFQKVFQIPLGLFFLFLLWGRWNGRRWDGVLLLVVTLTVATAAIRTTVLLAFFTGRAVLIHGHVTTGLVGPTDTPRS